MKKAIFNSSATQLVRQLIKDQLLTVALDTKTAQLLDNFASQEANFGTLVGTVDTLFVPIDVTEHVTTDNEVLMMDNDRTVILHYVKSHKSATNWDQIDKTVYNLFVYFPSKVDKNDKSPDAYIEEVKALFSSKDDTTEHFKMFNEFFKSMKSEISSRVEPPQGLLSRFKSF